MSEKIKWSKEKACWVADEPAKPHETKSSETKSSETKLRAYFAHSMRIYGTPEALLARLVIGRLLPDHEIFDPETIDWKTLAGQIGQDALYDKVIRFCTRVVVYEYKKHIGRGVFEEVSRAQALKRPIHVLRRVGNKIALLPVRGWQRAPGNDWKVRYGTLIV